MHRILFQSGPVTIYSFGVMLVIGLLAAMWLGRKRAPRYGLTPDQFVDASFWALVPGILGARIVFILQDWGYYSTHTDKLLSLQFEGITSFGGFIFGFLGLYTWARKNKKPLLSVLDAAGAPFLLAHAIGRIGCLLNGCCYGTHCDLAWGIHIPGQTGLFHPAQAYDSLMNIAALLLLLRVEKGFKLGQSFGLMLALHGTARFIYEFWRAGSVADVERGVASSTTIPGLPITEAHVMAAVFIVIGITIFVVRRGAKPVGATT